MQLAVINLDKSTDRLASFRAVNHFLPAVERFAAVDGRRLSRASLQADGLLDPQVAYTDGALGCALSHFALWERCIRQGTPLTICEDDAVFNHQFADAASALLATLAPDWDIVLWGWNFDIDLLVDVLPGVSPCLMYFNQQALRARLDRFQGMSIVPRALRLLRASGTLCYSLSPRGAQRLLSACRPIRGANLTLPGLPAPVRNAGIDSMMNASYPQLNAWVAFPPLVVSPNDHRTSLVQAAPGVG